MHGVGRRRVTFQVVMTRFMTSRMLIFREDGLPGRRDPFHDKQDGYLPGG